MEADATTVAEESERPKVHVVNGGNMDPIDILSEEHRLIRQALDAFSLATHKMEQGINPPLEFFEKAVEFSRTYIDKRHHFKEEYLMFGRLAEKHQSELDAEIEALRQQHDHGREFISEMGNALDGYGKGKDAQVTIMIENVAALVTLYRHHVHREDQTFFPMVEKDLSQEELDDLGELFVKEDEKGERGSLEGMQQLANELVALL
jgi:hemerythrin-like domain-containing protein